MKKMIFYLLPIFFLVGCAASPVYEMRQFPSYRLGVIQVGWMDPNWRVDVWVGQPGNNPAFTLMPGWQKEWQIDADNASVYAEAWIWHSGKKLLVAKTKPFMVKALTVRDYDGYGWRLVLQNSDFAVL